MSAHGPFCVGICVGPRHFAAVLMSRALPSLRRAQYPRATYPVLWARFGIRVPPTQEMTLDRKVVNQEPLTRTLPPPLINLTQNKIPPLSTVAHATSLPDVMDRQHTECVNPLFNSLHVRTLRHVAMALAQTAAPANANADCRAAPNSPAHTAPRPRQSTPDPTVAPKRPRTNTKLRY